MNESERPDLAAVAKMRDEMMARIEAGGEDDPMDGLSVERLRDAMYRPGALETMAEMLSSGAGAADPGMDAPAHCTQIVQTRDHHHLDVFVDLLDPGEQLEARGSRHLDVEKHECRRMIALRVGARLLGVPGGAHRETEVGELRFQQLTDRLLIVDDEDEFFHAARTRRLRSDLGALGFYTKVGIGVGPIRRAETRAADSGFWGRGRLPARRGWANTRG